jgi:hypothetical protein
VPDQELENQIERIEVPEYTEEDKNEGEEVPDQELENHIERIACLRAGDNDADLRIIYGGSDGQLRDGWQQG